MVLVRLGALKGGWCFQPTAFGFFNEAIAAIIPPKPYELFLRQMRQTASSAVDPGITLFFNKASFEVPEPRDVKPHDGPPSCV